MPFTRPTLITIIQRIEADMEQRLTGTVPLLAVGLLRILARVFAGAIHLLYGLLQWLAKQLFYDTAEESELDNHARRWGLTRKAAEFATGTITFTGVDGASIATGTLVVDEDGVELETTASGIIAAGTLTLAVEAVEPGDAGNLTAATVLIMIEPMSEITEVEVVSMAGGLDQESDSDLAGRIFERISTPPMGGTADDFERWAREVSGVADAWAFPNNPSLGTVSIVAKALGVDPVPAPALLSAVETNVNAKKPVTAGTAIEPIVSKLIDITIEIDTDYTPYENAIESNLSDFFGSEAAPGGTILWSQLNNAISTSGIPDYEITQITVAGTPVSLADIVFTGFEYPVLDDVFWTLI